MRLAADVGGTFTDVVAFDEATGQPRFGKTLTTPHRIVEGITDGAGKTGVRWSDVGMFLHGTTVVINALLERNGARTALITTQGFRDIYEIGRVNRPNAYDLYFRKHEPLIERALRFDIPERMSAAGEVLVALDEAEVARLGRALLADGVTAIAVVFLHSYRNPSHELRAKQILEDVAPGVFVTASHELSQEYREFERTSTAAANAYVGPRVRSYLDELSSTIKDARFTGDFLIVQSTGGLYDLEHARRQCIRILESGPAAGVIGANTVCERLRVRNAIAFDMGGTTAKAGVVSDGEVLMSGSVLIGGYAGGLPIQMPMIDVQEVGTGGGSIARVGAGRALRVGPQSAGAVPGPVCYGRGGTEPTVTDANLLLGRLAAHRFLGGEMQLNTVAAKVALRERVAEPLGISVTEAADGIVRIAVTAMAIVARRVTTERGLDPGAFALIGYGGAGPLHACLVARELGVSTVIIPPAPGHFSAFGMLVADLRHDFVRTWFTPVATADFALLERRYAPMEEEGRLAIERSGTRTESVTVARAADMRYVGQEHAVTVELPRALFVNRDHAGIKARFDVVHAVRYGYSDPAQPAEIVSLRSSTSGLLRKPGAQRLAARGGPPPVTERRLVYCEGAGFIETPTFDRVRLAPGDEIIGPALIEEHASTTVISFGDVLRVGDFGDLVITVAGASA
jgi:N-methylhydantoinase A